MTYKKLTKEEIKRKLQSSRAFEKIHAYEKELKGILQTAEKRTLKTMPFLRGVWLEDYEFDRLMKSVTYYCSALFDYELELEELDKELDLEEEFE